MTVLQSIESSSSSSRLEDVDWRFPRKDFGRLESPSPIMAAGVQIKVIVVEFKKHRKVGRKSRKKGEFFLKALLFYGFECIWSLAKQK